MTLISCFNFGDVVLSISTGETFMIDAIKFTRNGSSVEYGSRGCKWFTGSDLKIVDSVEPF